MNQPLQQMPVEIPAGLAELYATQPADLNKYTSGIGSTRGPHISAKNGMFTIIGQDKLAKTPLGPQGYPLIDPVKGAPFIDVVIVDSAEGLAKVYYEKGWVEGENAPPDCWSNDGLYPDNSILEPVSLSCFTCPNNKFGSAINEQTGAQGKLCADRKRIAVFYLWDLDGPIYEFSVSPSNLTRFAAYAGDMAGRVPGGVETVVTRIYVDKSPTAKQGALVFEPAPKPVANPQGGNTYPQGAGYWFISTDRARKHMEVRRSVECRKAIGADTQGQPLALAGPQAQQVIAAPQQQQQVDYRPAQTIENAPAQPDSAAPVKKRRTKAEMEAERALLAQTEANVKQAQHPAQTATNQTGADPMLTTGYAQPVQQPAAQGGGDPFAAPAQQIADIPASLDRRGELAAGGGNVQFGVATGTAPANAAMDAMLESL